MILKTKDLIQVDLENKGLIQVHLENTGLTDRDLENKGSGRSAQRRVKRSAILGLSSSQTEKAQPNWLRPLKFI